MGKHDGIRFMVEPAYQAWVPLCSCHHLELARTEVAAAQWQSCHLDTDPRGKTRLLCYMTTTACVHDEKYCSRKVALLGGRCRSYGWCRGFACSRQLLCFLPAPSCLKVLTQPVFVQCSLLPRACSFEFDRRDLHSFESWCRLHAI